MATARIIGTDTTGATPGGGTDAVSACRWAALADGIVSQIRLYANANGNVKVGLYTGTDYPTTRIAVRNTSTAVTASQWNTLDLESSVNVTKDTNYWIVVHQGNDSLLRIGTETSRPYKYRFITFSNGLPASFDSSWTDYSNNYLSCAAYGVLSLQPSAIASAEAIGSHSIETTSGTQNLAPSAIDSAEAIGSHTLTLLLQFLGPSSIASGEVIGSHAVSLYLQFITPTSIDSEEAIGSHAISRMGSLAPTGIASAESFGSITVVRFTYHPILDALFVATSPDTNRFYVIGRDGYGNPVYGSAIDSAEVALLGERLDFQVELSVPTTDQAGSVAAAMIAKRRLDKSEAQLLITPHCGVELWDVVQVTDTPTAQTSAIYRVSAIRFEYQLAARKPKLTHTLTLSPR